MATADRSQLSAAPLTVPRSRPFSLPNFGQVWPVLVGLLILSPLLMLLSNSLNVAPTGQDYRLGLTNWQMAISDPSALSALGNSFMLSITRTTISVPIAIGLSWLIARSNMPGRSFIELLAWMSIFIPVLPLAFGWILLLDPKFGLVNQFISQIAGTQVSPFSVYGFWGITWVHLASTAISYKVILLVPAFRRISASTEQAARMSGATAWETLTRITLPLLAPAILLVTAISLVLSFESFELELLFGLPVRLYVYSTRIYDLVSNQPSNVGEATALAVVFLVWLLFITWLYRKILGNKSYTTVSGRDYSTQQTNLGTWRWPAFITCIVFYAVCLLAPLTMLVLGSFMRLYGFFNVPNAWTTNQWAALFSDPAFANGVRNSFSIAAIASVAAVLLYSMLAYQVVRNPSTAMRFVDTAVWAPWAVPGILTSLSLLWLFLATPARTFLYGSVIGIGVAFVFRASPVSTQMFKTSLMQIGREVEESARMSGAGWFSTYRRVVLPLLAPSAVTVGLLTFLSSLYEISTPVLLYTPGSRPLSILMLEYGFSGARERASAIGVLITLTVLVVLLLSRTLGFKLSRDRT